MLIFSISFTYLFYGWPLTVFLYMHLKANVLRIFRDNSRFDLATSYKRKYVKKPILVSLGTQIFKSFSPVQTIVVPPGETNISKLLTTLLIFIRALSFKVGLMVLLYWVWLPQELEILPSCFQSIFERLFIVLSIFKFWEFLNFMWISHEFMNFNELYFIFYIHIFCWLCWWKREWFQFHHQRFFYY